MNKDIADLRLLRPRQVIETIGLSASRIRQLELADDFPKRIAIGPHAVAYRASDIRDWIEKRAAIGTHIGKGVTKKKPTVDTPVVTFADCPPFKRPTATKAAPAPSRTPTKGSK